METSNLTLRSGLIGYICECNYVFGMYVSESSVLVTLLVSSNGVLFYFTLRWSSPLLCLIVSHPSPFYLCSCLIGTGFSSLWRCVQIQLVCVMLCCLVLFSNGHSGQESSWTRTHAQTHIHVARGKSSQRLTIHSPHYHTACLSERTGSGGWGYVLLFHPRALSKRHGLSHVRQVGGRSKESSAANHT